MGGYTKVNVTENRRDEYKPFSLLRKLAVFLGNDGNCYMKTYSYDTVYNAIQLTGSGMGEVTTIPQYEAVLPVDAEINITKGVTHNEQI